MEIALGRFAALLRTTKFSRTLAFGAWTLLGGLFVLGQFAFLGWVGPAPIFVYWTIAAAPLTAVTAYWLRRYVEITPWWQIVVAGIVWSALMVVALTDPFAELRGLGAWISFIGMIVFPLILTYQVLALVEGRVPVRDTAHKRVRTSRHS